MARGLERCGEGSAADGDNDREVFTLFKVSLESAGADSTDRFRGFRVFSLVF